MSKILFPSWRYHATEPARIVASPEESEALGSAWSNTPGGAVSAAVGAVEAVDVVVAGTIADLVTEPSLGLKKPGRKPAK